MGNYRGRKMVPVPPEAPPVLEEAPGTRTRQATTQESDRLKLPGLGNTRREREAEQKLEVEGARGDGMACAQEARPEPFGVTESSIVDAPAADVWKLVSQFDRGEVTHPGCTACKMVRRQHPRHLTPGDVRLLTLKPTGKKVAQRLLDVDEAKMAVAYELAAWPEEGNTDVPESVFPCTVTDYRAEIRVRPITTQLGSAFLEISGRGLTNSQARSNAFLKDVFHRTLSLIGKQVERRSTFYT